MLRTQFKIVVALLLISAIALTPSVQAAAQTQYTIPLGESRWNQYELAFKVPTSPKWAHQVVLAAMDLWNQAQEWFKDTYYPNGQVYHLSESQSSKNLIVFDHVFNPDYSGTTNGTRSRKTTTESEIVLVLVYADGSPLPPDILLGVAVHEFGHVLSLGHTSVANDLMCTRELYQCTDNNGVPSTLDLYAVHVVAGGELPRSVTLPANIAYMSAPVKPPSAPVGLIIQGPEEARVSLDGAPIQVGSILLTTAGVHRIEVTPIIQLDNVDRLVFDEIAGNWNINGSYVTLPASVVSYNMTVAVIYHTEHYLKLESAVGRTEGEGWYADRATANFQISSAAEPMTGLLGRLGGRWQFEGWYENGSPLAGSMTGMIYMTRAHTLEAHWQPDYTEPYVLVMILILILIGSGVLLVLRRKVA
jgi:hypothetical protein